jgi:hypothetical protein
VPYSVRLKRLLLRLAAGWLAMGGPHSAAAAGARVVVVTEREASPLLQEALVRVQGELSAVGLSADVELDADDSVDGPEQRARQDVYGLLQLHQRAQQVLIRAWAPGASESLEARVDLATAGVTPEVVAVRAVETLRAAMLQFAQSQKGAVPAEVRGFTRFNPPAPPSTPPAAPPAASEPGHRASPPLSFWVGPSVSLHAGVAPDLGAQFGLLVGPGTAFAAAAFETTLSDVHLAAEHGSADARRQVAWLQLGVRFRPSESWEIATRGGAGYAAFTISGKGETGYHGSTTTHGSWAVMLGVSSVYWATRSFGLYGSVGGRLATDAPRIYIAEKQVITLDRPSFVVSLGASVGMF